MLSKFVKLIGLLFGDPSESARLVDGLANERITNTLLDRSGDCGERVDNTDPVNSSYNAF